VWCYVLDAQLNYVLCFMIQQVLYRVRMVLPITLLSLYSLAQAQCVPAVPTLLASLPLQTPSRCASAHICCGCVDVACRYCLGAALAMAEMKIFLALLARHYSFEADNDTEWKPALGYYPANGLPLVLTQLQQA
jgi:hypothetical protein